MRIKKINYLAFLGGCICTVITPFVSAASVTHLVPWNNSSVLAGTCISTASELAPLSVPKTLVVSNNVPNGTVLYSWDYDSFIPSYSVICHGGTAVSSGSVNTRLFLSLGTGGYDQINRAHKFLNNQGVGLRFYYTQLSQGTDSGSGKIRVTDNNQGWVNGVHPIGIEYEYKGSSVTPGGWITASSINSQTLNSRTHSFSSRWRAELIKIGNIDYTKSPLVSNNSARLFSPDISSSSVNFPNILGGGGIKINQPSCRLAGPTTYTVNLGHWQPQTKNFDSTSHVGKNVPIDISLECNEALNNVQFAFQDTGSIAQTNGSVGLYDSSGVKISGLEIEIHYNGTPIEVGRKTSSLGSLSKFSVGPRTGGDGTYYDGRVFTNVSPAKFTARFVQRAPITRAVSQYAGIVSGHVNLFVTYN